MPSSPAGDLPAGRARRAPAVVTKLVTAGLILVAGGVVYSAMGHGSTDAVGARPAAATNPALVVTGTEPDTVRLLGARRVGDAILLNVDPVGSGGRRTLIVAPGARVVLRTGPVPLLSVTDRSAGVGAVLRLGYDALGQVVTLTEAR